jgi:hypothetical protein
VCAASPSSCVVADGVAAKRRFSDAIETNRHPLTCDTIGDHARDRCPFRRSRRTGFKAQRPDAAAADAVAKPLRWAAPANTRPTAPCSNILETRRACPLDKPMSL